MCVMFLLFLVPAIMARSSGPPVGTFINLCTDMIPTGHNGGVSMAADTANPPYTITTSADKYTAGGVVTVTITGTGGNMFKGFFVQARRTDPAMNNDVAFGTFSSPPPVTTQLLQCHTVANSAWGHSNKDVRSTIAATWNAPMQCEGPIEFRATIVKGDPTLAYFYLNVTSDGLACMEGTQPPAGDTTTPNAAVDTTPSKASVTLPLALTTIALGLAALMAVHRQ